MLSYLSGLHLLHGPRQQYGTPHSVVAVLLRVLFVRRWPVFALFPAPFSFLVVGGWAGVQARAPPQVVLRTCWRFFFSIALAAPSTPWKVTVSTLRFFAIYTQW